MKLMSFCTAMTALAFFFNTGVFAQDTLATADTVKHWKKKLDLGINVNQASFSSNWTGGGVNSIGLNVMFNYSAKFSSGRHSWDNEIGLQYGFVKNEGQGFRKTLDRIFLDSKYGYSLSKHWSLFTSLNLLSQFAPGYSYASDPGGVETASLISDFFAPAYVTSAWGVEYRREEHFRVRASPFTPRITIVRDPERFVSTVGPNPFGVTPPDDTRIEWLALQLVAEYNREVAENLNLRWRYTVFANYETLEFDKIDHRLEVSLLAKVNKFINVGLGGILLYDFDQVNEVQLSQLFTLGFAYKFQNYADK